MIPIARSPENPLNKYRDGCIAGPAAQPVPLVATRMSVSIRGGLAFVTTARTFRNDEDASIEATITFPVPVDATLTGLTARIGDRVLTGRAKARDEARDTYETAIDEGRSAVLHEEALRGIHVLSIAHVPPGAEIAVESRHVQALSFVGEVARLRIPTTVGQIYGVSPLLDSDDLVTGTVVHEAEIEVVCEDGKASLEGVTLDKGRARVRLDRPLDISIADFVARPLSGSGAGGKAVTVNVTPAARATAPLNASILVDRSGSMDGLPFEVLRVALVTRSQPSMPRTRYGSSSSARGRLRRRRHRPQEGGRADQKADLARRRHGDRRRAQRGRGPASEGRHSHRHGRPQPRPRCAGARGDGLPLLGRADRGRQPRGQDRPPRGSYGGRDFAVPAAATGEAMRAALNGLRTFNRRPEIRLDEPTEIEVQRAGTTIHVNWQAARANASVDDLGAFAAGLALPALPEGTAAEWAERHGIVGHLTSLVLVDQAGEAQEGLPITRKVPLMAFSAACVSDALSCAPLEVTALLRELRRSGGFARP